MPSGLLLDSSSQEILPPHPAPPVARRAGQTVGDVSLQQDTPFEAQPYPPTRPVQASRGTISTGRWMWEGIRAVSTAIVLFLLIRALFVEAFKIPTGSMEN